MHNYHQNNTLTKTRWLAKKITNKLRHIPSMKLNALIYKDKDN